MELILGLMEVSLPDFAKEPGMVLVHHDAMVMLPSRITPPSRMLSVLADTPMPRADVPPLLPVLVQTGRHCVPCAALRPPGALPGASLYLGQRVAEKRAREEGIAGFDFVETPTPN